MSRTTRLWFEFAAIYAAAPLAMAWLVFERIVPASRMPGAFAALFILAICLLFATEGFRWRDLMKGRLIADWRALLAYSAVTLGAIYLLTLWLTPHALFGFPNRAPEIWTRVMIFYPILSVIPQGIIYRALFFGRYRSLFSSPVQSIVVGALAFGLAHLFFLNWVAVALTVVGGAAFGWAHLERRSFWFGNLLHAIGGWSVFTIGLGRFFYHGAI